MAPDKKSRNFSKSTDRTAISKIAKKTSRISRKAASIEDNSTPAKLSTGKSRKRAADFFNADEENEETEGWGDAIKPKKVKLAKAGVPLNYSKNIKENELPKVKEDLKAASTITEMRASNKSKLKTLGGQTKSTQSSKVKKPKDSNVSEEASDVETGSDLKHISLKSSPDKKTKNIGKQNAAKTVSPNRTPDPKDLPALPESSEDDTEDDQTVALLKGFQSEDESSEDSGSVKDLEIHSLPIQNQIIPKVLTGKDDPAGVIYVGRIPHGFYEHQMRAYFSQFGTITRLRISRNLKTGRSKHYAFIEFASSEVAKIVAATMDNYLMYNHLLKCKFVPSDQIHASLWKGANKTFRRIPWGKREREGLEEAKSLETWKGKIVKEEKRRKLRARKLKAKGIDYDYEALPLRLAEDDQVKALEATE
ncbi:MAG: hypothetical protein M1829_003775 [Trizodia sp. TS-e1964]|nr:MAG: hypothetical protein M1829_003775 [Trizodia sp. TS-e1964]